MRGLALGLVVAAGVAGFATAGFLLAPSLGGRGEAGAGTAAIGGPFRLVSQTGAPFSDADLAGKPFAVFFGFTHCPEVCPTTLWETSEALKALGSDADRLRVLFVSVDPARDTPEALRQYLTAFDPRIVGLTGTESEIEAVAEAYRVYRRKVPTEDGGYTMDHTATVYLMGADGRFRGTIAYEEAAGTRLAKLRRLVADRPV